MTDAERQRRYIEKMKKEGKYDILKKKRAEYEKEKRKKAKDLLKNCSKTELMQKLSVSRAKDRERQRRYRQMKREKRILSIISSLDGNERADSKSPTNFPSIFETESWAEKAVAKAKRALPASPSRKKSVIAELLGSLDEDSQRDIICNTAIIKKNTPNEKRIEFFEAVQKFYEREDLSGLSLDSDDEDVKPFNHVVKGIHFFFNLMLFFCLAIELKHVHYLF